MGGFVPSFRSWPLGQRSGRVPALPHPPPKCPLVYTTAVQLIQLVVLGSPLRVGCCQFLSPCGPDCLSATGQLVRRGDVGDGTVQSHGVVVGHERRDEPSGVVQAQRGLKANVVSFQCFVPPLHLPVTRSRQVHPILAVAPKRSRSLIPAARYVGVNSPS